MEDGVNGPLCNRSMTKVGGSLVFDKGFNFFPDDFEVWKN